MCSAAKGVGQKRMRSCHILKAFTSLPCQTTPRSRMTRSISGSLATADSVLNSCMATDFLLRGPSATNHLQGLMRMGIVFDYASLYQVTFTENGSGKPAESTSTSLLFPPRHNFSFFGKQGTAFLKCISLAYNAVVSAAEPSLSFGFVAPIAMILIRNEAIRAATGGSVFSSVIPGETCATICDKPHSLILQSVS